MDLLTLLQKASKEGQGVEVVYQPKVNKDLQVVGAEALVRLITPTGVIMPGTFIDLAEEHGFMTGIGHFVLSNVITFQASCIANGITPVPISVNIAPSQISTTIFINTMVTMLEAKNVPLSLIELELVESLLDASLENKQNTLMASIIILLAKQVGIKVAIDDFGIGHSTLSRLVDMPVQTIKIDRRFADITAPRNAAAVIGTIKMAKDMKLEIVVEGVETKEQADFFWNEGVDFIQGFYYFTPINTSDFLLLLLNKSISKI
jgi:EAL domain-containing protein (putative c-di-GMP-specific phosphodiesterase class I)